MLDRRNLAEEIKSNQDKLDGCKKPHDFQPVLPLYPISREDGSANLYRCSKCDGLVDAMSGLRYSLNGKFG
jgi:hypothetical protein